MGDLLDRGSAFLDDQRHKHMSRTVVYQRGAEAKEVQATIGKTEFEQADDAGLIHRVESRDFLIRTVGPAVLVIGIAVAGVGMALGDERAMQRGALAAGGGALILLSRAILDFISHVAHF